MTPHGRRGCHGSDVDRRANPDNWSDHEIGLYFSKRDSRVVVPKRERELGWTFNLARARGALAFIALLLSPSVVLLIVLLIAAMRRLL